MAVAARKHRIGRDAPYAPPFEASEIATSIAERFRRVVAEQGQREAVVSEQESLTYQALDHASDRVAGELLRARGEQQEVVTLFLEQGAGAIVAALGIIKVGKICLALHPGLPVPRARQLIAQAGSSLLISSQALMQDAAALLPPEGLVWELSRLRGGKAAAAPLTIDPWQTAVLLPTSGSTGDPKLVMRSHTAAIQNAWSNGHGCDITPADRVGLTAFFGYGAGASGTFNSLLVGSTLVVLQIEARTPDEIIKQLRTFDVSVIMISAPLLAQILAALPNDAELPALRRVRSSGQTLHASLVRDFRRKLGRRCRLINGLASSETSGVCHADVSDPRFQREENVPVGFPVPGKEILILDEEQALVPAGEVGEIGVLSNYVSEGYWGDLELTAARFLADPLGSGKRLYLTGDLGKLRPDGMLALHGRLASWTKIRGHKVQLAEIEKALLALDEVQAGAVRAVAGARGEDELAAYLVIANEEKESKARLRRYLSTQLPEHFIPAHFIFLDRLPLLANGKVDRQALPAPARAQAAGLSAAPQTLVEEVLVMIWSEVFSNEPIGRDDDFFVLGGTSLSAAQIIARIRALFGIEVEFSVLFQHPHLVDLASLIESRLGS